VPGELNDFTPFGYLSNPSHLATGWGEVEGGNLRTAPDWLGVEWVYPVGRDASSRATLALETSVDGRLCRARGDFNALGMTSRHHSCLVFGCDWQASDVMVEARFFLAGDNALCVRLRAVNAASEPRQMSVKAVLHEEGAAPLSHVLLGPPSLEVTLAPKTVARQVNALGRGADAESAHEHGTHGMADAEAVYTELLAVDAAFDASCPSLSGDWPASWREGLHHDFQTTRLLVQPPGGVFRDVWPAWMASWPRVVLAEGTLDMLRLAYADPSLALRAVLSLFRDAPQPNLPCLFRGGEYNMVAADGSRCGTSPAWCLPFLNLELLYLRTLDRAWLAQVYPRAAAYVEWWLENRTDPAGWLVYKCTWESGEDGNPRLDPSGSGDADTSNRVRPVELQATLAHAAGVLAFFAAELDIDAGRWEPIEGAYRERTRQLFNVEEGRYCDWLITERRAQTACPEQWYWGIDACRYSAQALTALLIGLPLDEAEVWRHAAPPWTLWPSWTWSLVESAAAAGLYVGIGEVAFGTIDRVYRMTTRRDLSDLARPMPGTSPEYWPEDWRTYGGSDAYGWGATTANLLLRHLFGFKEARETDSWVAELTPAFPARMCWPGARYAIRRLSYRGVQFDLAYTVIDDAELQAELDLLDAARECQVERAGRLVFASQTAAAHHEFRVRVGERHTLRLGPRA
jgi:hypothetical protein